MAPSPANETKGNDGVRVSFVAGADSQFITVSVRKDAVKDVGDQFEWNAKNFGSGRVVEMSDLCEHALVSHTRWASAGVGRTVVLLARVVDLAFFESCAASSSLGSGETVVHVGIVNSELTSDWTDICEGEEQVLSMVRGHKDEQDTNAPRSKQQPNSFLARGPL